MQKLCWQYKSEDADLNVKLQNESYTSKTNCLTDEILENLELNDRKVKLTKDFVIDRDLNGAINIARKAKGVCFTQEEILKHGFRKMYMGQNGELCTNKIYLTCNLL